MHYYLFVIGIYHYFKLNIYDLCTLVTNNNGFILRNCYFLISTKHGQLNYLRDNLGRVIIRFDRFQPTWIRLVYMLSPKGKVQLLPKT